MVLTGKGHLGPDIWLEIPQQVESTKSENNVEHRDNTVTKR